MILTRTHALYYAQHTLPAALRQHAQKVSIDSVVNAHGNKQPLAYINTDMHNTLMWLRMVRKRSEEEMVSALMERASLHPGRETLHVDRRIAYCHKWWQKILKGRKHANRN